MTDATAIAAPADTRKAGRYVYGAAVALLCAWVLVPIYFLLINTLSSPEAVNAFPKSFVPEFDLGSLTFFATFAGMLSALKNSILVAALTMIMSIVVGAPGAGAEKQAPPVLMPKVPSMKVSGAGGALMKQLPKVMLVKPFEQLNWIVPPEGQGTEMSPGIGKGPEAPPVGFASAPKPES